jgi:DNA polymerase V
VYSIDEAFLDLTHLPLQQSALEFGVRIREKIRRDVGLPVCVGIGPTKTLAKLANHRAKRTPGGLGVVDLCDPEARALALAETSVGDVWGVGPALTRALSHYGIVSAADLAGADAKALRRTFSVVLERTLRELRAEPCLEIERSEPARQEIICSRTFGARITELSAMREALSSYVARAARKLRAQRSRARAIQVSIRTSAFERGAPHYANAAGVRLPHPSADTGVLIGAAHALLKHLWREGYQYTKAGVLLYELSGEEHSPLDLFAGEGDCPRRAKLMDIADAINRRGLGRVFHASEGTRQGWTMRRSRLSPAYTTRWSDLPVAR